MFGTNYDTESDEVKNNLLNYNILYILNYSTTYALLFSYTVKSFILNNHVNKLRSEILDYTAYDELFKLNIL